jgi:hypothetical protein
MNNTYRTSPILSSVPPLYSPFVARKDCILLPFPGSRSPSPFNPDLGHFFLCFLPEIYVNLGFYGRVIVEEG